MNKLEIYTDFKHLKASIAKYANYVLEEDSTQCLALNFAKMDAGW
ncbi:MAG: hypothetical protein ACI9CE_000909 [Flavobacterium sp.]|jgi:hypothetical protein